MYERGISSNKLTFVIKIDNYYLNNLGQNPFLNTLNLFINRELSFFKNNKKLTLSQTIILGNSWTLYNDKELHFWTCDQQACQGIQQCYRKKSENYVGSILPCLCILRLRCHFQLKIKLLQSSKVGTHMSWAKAQTKMDAHKCPDLLFPDPPLWTWAWLHNESQAVWHSCHHRTKTLHITFSHQIPHTRSRSSSSYHSLTSTHTQQMLWLAANTLGCKSLFIYLFIWPVTDIYW